MTKFKAKKPLILWTTMAKVEEIAPRKGRYAIYCLLYTSAGNFCCSEKLASRISLFEPYEIRGSVKIAPGGTYLWVMSMELFHADGYRKGFSQPEDGVRDSRTSESI